MLQSLSSSKEINESFDFIESSLEKNPNSMPFIKEEMSFSSISSEKKILYEEGKFLFLLKFSIKDCEKLLSMICSLSNKTLSSIFIEQ